MLALADRVEKQERGRTLFQILWTFLTNSALKGFFTGSIYQGKLKYMCVPGLNCYSCPGALGACPVGSFQAMLADMSIRIPYYVSGLLLIFGALFGRVICGWMCPFGLFQELLYKIKAPFIRKRRDLPGDRILRYLKYVIGAVFVVILPLFVRDFIGMGAPAFCKYICPSGTLLGGWPLTALNPSLRSGLGVLFAWKSLLLIAVILLSVFSFRPFCKYICPLGAFYGFFNKVALYRLRLEKKLCIDCGACSRVCPMGVNPSVAPGSCECIRCGRCVASCPVGALSMTLPRKKEME